MSTCPLPTITPTRTPPPPFPGGIRIVGAPSMWIFIVMSLFVGSQVSPACWRSWAHARRLARRGRRPPPPAVRCYQYSNSSSEPEARCPRVMAAEAEGVSHAEPGTAPGGAPAGIIGGARPRTLRDVGGGRRSSGAISTTLEPLSFEPPGRLGTPASGANVGRGPAPGMRPWRDDDTSLNLCGADPLTNHVPTPPHPRVRPMAGSRMSRPRPVS